MNAPVMMSCTSFCAPKPIARPSTPAPASSGAMSTPISDRTSIRATVAITTVAALRSSASSVRARALGRRRRLGLSRNSIHDESASQISPETRRMIVAPISRATISLPAALAAQFTTSNSPHARAIIRTTPSSTSMRMT